MKSIVKNLLWKEFQELKSVTIAAVAIALSIPLCYVFRNRSDAFFAVMTEFMFYPLVASVFFGMRAAAGERTGRVGQLLAALSVSDRVLGAARLGAISAAAIAPLLALLPLGLALSLAEIHSEQGGIFATFFFCALSMMATVCLLSIVAAAGTGQPTEIRAGAVGIAAIVGIWFAWSFSFACVSVIVQNLRPQYVEYPSPAWTIFSVLETVGLVGFMLSTAVLLAVLPPVIFISRYARALGPFDLRPGKRWTLPKLNTLLPRIPVWHLSRWSNSAAMALLWKATREMGLVGLLVFLVSLLFSMVAAAFGLADRGPTTPFFAATSESLRPFLWFGGFVLSILIGVGAAIGDVQAGVNTFWRSRPISPSAWYWSKYVVGLLTILVAIEMPAFVCIGYRNPVPEELSGWFFWMLIWNATFSLALTATCLVRQPLQAAILAIGASGLLFAAVQAIFASGSEEPGPLALPAFVIAFVAAWIVSTILGSWAAEHDVAIS